MRFLYQPPKIIRSIYPNAIWQKSATQKTIYLTFDDGPIPELTPWVISILNKYNIKATFFCVGENIKKYPNLFKCLKNEEYQIGNHTYNHLNGWKTSCNNYMSNIEQCQALTQTNLFRPPYGKITKQQYKALNTKYDLVFWDVLTHDYSKNISPETCLKNAVKYTRNGSIVVFHDNLKAKVNLQYVLPKYIEHFLKLNYKFAIL